MVNSSALGWRVFVDEKGTLKLESDGCCDLTPGGRRLRVI